MSDKRLRAQFRKREVQLRELWNAFDPIGVMDDPEWPRDEYDRYLPHTPRLLMDKAGAVAIARWIANVAEDEMHMPVGHQAAMDFARKLEAWFESSGNMSGE